MFHLLIHYRWHFFTIFLLSIYISHLLSFTYLLICSLILWFLLSILLLLDTQSLKRGYANVHLLRHIISVVIIWHLFRLFGWVICIYNLVYIGRWQIIVKLSLYVSIQSCVNHIIEYNITLGHKIDQVQIVLTTKEASNIIVLGRGWLVLPPAQQSTWMVIRFGTNQIVYFREEKLTKCCWSVCNKPMTNSFISTGNCYFLLHSQNQCK